jgi:excisionase family DNA binding protein
MSEQEAERRARQRAASAALRGSMTVAEWCEYRRLSRSMVYKLWSEGRGPATHFVGTKRLVSSEADAAWLSEREAEAAA